MAAGFRSLSQPPLRLLSLLFLVLDCLLLVLFSVPSRGEYACLNSKPEYCGRLNISYPFWKSSDPPPIKYCGYQRFEVTCEYGDTPILRLGDFNYRVLKIDDKAVVISFAEVEIFNPTSNYCPGDLHNVTLPSDVSLSYANDDVNITFFFDCTDDGESQNNLTSCPHLGKSYVFGENQENAPRNCGEILALPVLRSYIPDPSQLVSEYAAALRMGFELNWSNNADIFCATCERSGGRCGMNYTNNDPVSACFHSNDTNEESQSPQRKHHNKALIIGTVTGALVAVGLLCAGILFFYRYKKKRDYSASMKSFIRSASSGPSSRDPEKYSVHFQAYIFSYDELQEATNGFDNELGDGGFGRVYKGKLPDGRVVAVKRLYENNYRRLEQFMNEIEILSRVRHQNLVDLYGWTSRDSKELLLVYEFVPNGTVADHLHGSRAREGMLTLPMRLNIAVETAEALAYLHAIDPPIIHRDVKTSNILLDSSFHVKVADFGLSRLFPFNATHVSTAPQGTPGYVDPEYHQCYQLTNRSDVYSFGVVLVELLSSKPAVDITRHRKEINLANWALNRIQNGELDQLADESLGYQSDQAARKIVTMVSEVAFRCLQVDGDMRPPMKEVLEALLAIQSEVDKVSKGGKEPGDNEDDAELLKNVVPMSPNTVINQWVSNSTTPNTSND